MTSNSVTAPMTTMTLLTQGNVAAKTTASTSSSTTVSSSAKPSSTKARLLFNSDGSVKLMGDIAHFPGIVTDKNSHNLVPTVGPDGKMKMLLTPSDGRGKTFILNPTNGGSLPSPNVIGIPGIQVGSKSTSILTSSTSITKVLPTPQVASRTPTTQIILSSDQLKPASKSQISLLSNIKSTPVPVTNTSFETHMRIDPSGSVTSTVRIPCSSAHNTPSTNTSVCQSVPGATAVLMKQLADKVTTIKKEPEDITCHNDAGGSGSSHPNMKVPGGTEGKDFHGKLSNNQWTKVNSVMPTAPPSTVVVPSQSQAVVGQGLISTGVFPKPVTQTYMIIQKNTSGVIAPPASSQAALSTVDVFPVTSKPSLSTTVTSSAVPTMMFGHNYAASLSDNISSASPTMTTNMNLAPQTSYSFQNTLPQKVVYPANFIKQVKDTVNIAPSVMPTQTVVKVPSLDPKVCNQGSLIGGSSYILDTKSGHLTSVALGPKDVCNKGVTDRSLRIGDAKIGCLTRAAPTTKDVCNQGSLIGGSSYILDANSGCQIAVAPDPKDVCNKGSVIDRSLFIGDAKIGCLTGVAPSPKDVCNQGSLTDGSSCIEDAKSQCLTPVAPDPIQQDPDDGVLSIKIDSVFSLAVKEETKVKTRQKRVRNKSTKCSSGDKVEDESHKEPVIKKETSVESETTGEPEIVTCPPSYVVLEQLSQKQIEDPKRHIIKCSNYCRLRTLNFLCKLGLVNCEPTVHISKCVSKNEPNECVNSKHEEMQKTKRKEQPQRESSPQSKTSPHVPPSYPKKESLGAGDGSKVRKVESPASPKLVQKVIKFTKVDYESSSKSVTVPQSATPKSSTPAPPPVSSSASATTKSVIPPGFSNPNSVPLRPLLNTTQTNLVVGKSTLKLPCSIASKPPALSDGANANKKHYYLFTLNGQNVLVPVSNDVMKPTAYMLKGNTLSALSNTTSVTTNTPTVTNVGPGSNVLVQRLPTPPQTPALKRLTNTVHQETPPSKASKLTEEKMKKDKPATDLPAGIRIKSEPVTRGYGDEKPVESPPKKKSRKQVVKIKQEPVNDEWQEVWSSKAVPVESPETAPSLKKQSPTFTTVSKDGSASTLGDSRAEGDDTMPTLPMMQLPSTKDRAHKMAVHNDRVERLKAVLRQKEKEIEDLKKRRMEDGAVMDDCYGVQDTNSDKCTTDDGETGHSVINEPSS